jgi:hypothetical protein
MLSHVNIHRSDMRRDISLPQFLVKFTIIIVFICSKCLLIIIFQIINHLKRQFEFGKIASYCRLNLTSKTIPVFHQYMLHVTQLNRLIFRFPVYFRFQRKIAFKSISGETLVRLYENIGYQILCPSLQVHHLQFILSSSRDVSAVSVLLSGYNCIILPGYNYFVIS